MGCVYMSKLKQKRFIYSTTKGKKSIYVDFLNDSVWLNKKQLADLLLVSPEFMSDKLLEMEKYELYKKELVSRNFLVPDYKYVYEARTKANTKYYSIDIILAIGYRLEPNITNQFRRWVDEELAGRWRSKNLYIYFCQLIFSILIIGLCFFIGSNLESIFDCFVNFFNLNIKSREDMVDNIAVGLWILGVGTFIQLYYFIFEAMRYYNQSF